MEDQRIVQLEGVTTKSSSNIQNAANLNGITFVLIPANDASSAQELLLAPSKDNNNNKYDSDPFMGLLAPYYQLQPGETVDTKLLEQQAFASREAGCSTGMCPHVSPLTLKRAAEEGTLERIKLSEKENLVGGTNTSSTSIITYMYYDDSAHLKQRPVNQSATKHSKDKNDGETIYGDAFVARMVKNNINSNSSLQLIPVGIQDLKEGRMGS